MRIDAKIACGLGHELAKPDSPDRALRGWVIGALDLDVGAVEQRPVGDRQTRASQGAVTCVAQRSSLYGLEDFRGSQSGAWGKSGGSSDRAQGIIVPKGLRCCKEKKAICLAPAQSLIITHERAQGARSFGDRDQLAVRANREDETICASQRFGGQGSGTDPCSQRKDEPKCAISRL